MIADHKLLQRRSGFSLLELMIVLAVMAGGMALVWPNLRKNMQRATLNDTAQTVRTTLGDARYEAMRSGKIWLVQLDRDGRKLTSGPIDHFADQLAGEAGESSSASWPSANTSADPNSLLTVYLPDRIEFQQIAIDSTSRSPIETAVDDEHTENTIGSDTDASDWGSLMGESNASNASTAKSLAWIPFLPTGNGRDVTVRIADQVSGDSVAIQFTSATGSIEILP